jgi:hypothetical protein
VSFASSGQPASPEPVLFERDADLAKRATCPPHSQKTISRLDHGVSSLNLGISREFWRKFAIRGPRDSSDHCSTD